MNWAKIVPGCEMPEPLEDVLVIIEGAYGPLFCAGWMSEDGKWHSPDGEFWNPPTHWARVGMPGEEAPLQPPSPALL